MNTTLLLCLIGGGVLLLLVVAILLIRHSNKKRFDKLQENINKYKQESEKYKTGSEGIENNTKITLASDQPAKPKEEEKPNENVSPIIEEYDGGNKNLRNLRQPRRNITSDEDFKRFLRNNGIDASPKESANKKDEFEDFLDQHAYSRRIIGKDIMVKLKNLPPEIKAVILSNVFNKYDD